MKTIKAFTLIELLVVMVVLTILLGFIIPKVTGTLDKANRAKCIKNLKNLHQGVIAFATDEERRKGYGANPIPDLPTHELLSNDYATGNANYKRSVISYYLNTKSEKFKCPFAPNNPFTYKINSHIMNAAYKVYTNNFESMNTSNILIHEWPNTHNNDKAFGITIYGDIIFDIDDESDLTYKTP